MKKGAEDWRLVLSSHDMNKMSYKSMNRVRKEKTCRGKEGLLLLPLFVEKKYEGQGLEQGRIWNGTPLPLSFEIRGDAIMEPILEGMFHGSES